MKSRAFDSISGSVSIILHQINSAYCLQGQEGKERYDSLSPPEVLLPISCLCGIWR